MSFRVECLFSIALWLSTLLAYKARCSARFVFLVQDPLAGEPNVGLGPLTLWGEPLQF